MDAIHEFLQRYAKEYDYYAEVGRLAAARLESSLDAAGVRAIVTHRAKNAARLEAKLRKRDPDKNYASADEVYSDIVDLAGVRVALYFPGDRELVANVIKQDFESLEHPRAFPRDDSRSAENRFSGYAATHYRVRLRSDSRDELQTRYSAAAVEIQVASILMHAWAEVEHDLAYKPTQGAISSQERSLLDQLNGLVLAGEIALEQLQSAGQERAGESDRVFNSHYDLAAHLIRRAETHHSRPSVQEEGLGRVDLLFDLLVRLGRATPRGIAPQIEQLHGDLERRPLAEQVIDSLIAEDAARYRVFADVRAAHATSGGSEHQQQFAGVGEFMSEWIKLEQLLRQQVSPSGAPSPVLIRKAFASLGLDGNESLTFDRLRRLRNMLVHGIEIPSEDMLDDATASVRLLSRRVSEASRDRPTDDVTP